VTSPFRSIRHPRAALAFAALFGAVQLLLWYAYYRHGAKLLIGDEQHYQQAALATLGGGPWMTSPIWPPLQPVFLAALYLPFGVHLPVVQVAQTVLFVACAALLRDLWRHLGGSVAAANAAAALFLLHPGIAGFAHWLWPEIPHLFLLLAAACLLVRAPSPARAALAGLCIGLAILAKSLLSPFWPVFLLVFLRRGRPRLAWRAAGAFVLGLVLVTAPALLHGWRSYGTPMIADSSIYNLRIGLTDRWRSDYIGDMGGVTLPEYLASGATPAERNAAWRDDVLALVRERGPLALLAGQLERQYFRLFSAKTLLVSQLPGPACAGHLSVYRASPLLTHVSTALNHVLHAAMLALAAFGLAIARRPRAVAQAPQVVAMRWVLALFVAYQLALFLLIHVKARFLLPMTPILCGLAGTALARIGGRDGGMEDASSLRIAFGALLAALLLFLAFGGPLLDRSCT